jgi:hypothetical protein
MKITTMAAITALAPASPVMAQQEHPMPPGIQELANEHIGLQGYNPFGPSCSPGMEDISRDEAVHRQWSFFVCRDGTIDCQLSQHVYICELKATYAVASQPKGFYATNIKPLRLLLGMMQALGTAGKDPAE